MITAAIVIGSALALLAIVTIILTIGINNRPLPGTSPP